MHTCGVNRKNDSTTILVPLSYNSLQSLSERARSRFMFLKIEKLQINLVKLKKTDSMFVVKSSQLGKQILVHCTTLLEDVNTVMT